ncbi:FHA domain-containing protein [Planctomycetota bacterium]
MDAKKLLFTGIDGYSKEEAFDIKEGASKVVGRSRSCDFSLRKMKGWMEASEEEREGADDFKTVSRRHLKVEVIKEDEAVLVKMTDLSRNGTFVDEDRIGPLFEIKEWEDPHYVRLGEVEKFKLELVEDTGEDAPEQEEGGEDPEDEDAEEDPKHETGREEKLADSDEDDDEPAAAEESGEEAEEDEKPEDEEKPEE